MSDFFKKFLAEDPRRLSPSGRFVGLAAFGKHPGWDDHVENLGLETESLNFARMVLYVDGIGGQIDSGAWEKLEPAQQLPDFNHLFVWQRSGQILVGRLWSSSDGKGRTRYPMVVCLHFVGVTLGWALKQGLPALAEVQEECVKTTLAEDVRSLLNRKRAALREAIQAADGRGEYAPVTPETLHKTLQPAGDAKPESFLRVLYQIQSQFRAFAPGEFNTRANPAAPRAQQIRVPAAGENPEQALLFWTRFFLTHVDASVPLLLALPLEAGWVDITAGEPESQEFFCLRASPKAVPMVSEVPYTLDDAFRAKAAAFLGGFQQGETTAADLQPASAAASVGETSAPAKGGWRKWLGAGALIIICAVAAIVFLPKDVEQQATGDASDARAKITNPVSKVEIVSSTPADAAKSKAEVEAPAKEKERQVAEAIRLAKENEAAMQNKLQEQKYQTAMKDGQTAFERKDYDEAISQASLALDIKTKDPVATRLRIEAQRQLDVVNNARALEQKYQIAMKDGQAALDRKDYDEAITRAGVALETKATDPVAMRLLTDAQRQLDLANQTKAQEQKYQTAMKDGQAALDRKQYAEAIAQAGVALEIKAKDSAATKFLTEAQRQLDLVNDTKAQEQKYQTAMKDGQAALDRKQYAEAITQAGVALETKANDPAATKLKIEAQQQLDLATTAKAQEQRRNAAEAAAPKKTADEQAKANTELAVSSAAKATDPKPAAASPSSALPPRGEITNGIGMVLVQVSSEILVGKYEVTQAEYRKVMRKNPSKSVNDRQPVEQVAWNDAKEFCRKLTEMERGQLPAGKAYALPTEKQWTEFLGGQRFEDLPGGGVTGKGGPAVVGESGPANKFGLFDVLGNVWEWCLDNDDANRGQKVLKGGAFNSTNFRATLFPDKQVPNCGFRCVLAAP